MNSRKRTGRNKYLTAFMAVMTLAACLRAEDFSVQVIHVFETPGPYAPDSGVLQTCDGSLHGVTPSGDALEGGNGYGDIYQIAPGGQISVLAVFDGSFGLYPRAGLVKGADGNLYGSPSVGGPNGAVLSFFKITPDGIVTNFAESYGFTNGYEPDYAMILANDGNFYGTTTYGGAGYNTTDDAYNGGTVFKITQDGQYTVLYSFIGTNGFSPIGRLMQASDGNIYGATSFGGQFGLGTIFRVSTNGSFDTIYSFNGTTNAVPGTGLVQGDDGCLYGMTEGNENSSSAGYGTIYRISTNGCFAVVASFNSTNGLYPIGSLVKGTEGEVFGLAQLGGANGGGTVFKLTTHHEIKVIASFDSDTGEWPTELTRGQDGNIYGTTTVLGPDEYADGTIFRLVRTPKVCSTISNGIVSLNWNSFTGGVYQVQYKNSLTDPAWTPLGDQIMATSNCLSFTDSPPAAARFYQVSLLPL
jgi:uncharacterized repeat protein (TIGR03803 family)